MLTLKSNGNSSANIVRADWWNDYYNLLTGIMKDQPVNISNNLILQATLATAPGSGAFCTAVSGGNLGIGTYKYVTSFVTGGIESQPSPSASVTTSGTNTAVNYQSIQTGPTGTTQRVIYRTKVNGSTFYQLTTLNDNTTTFFADTLLDSGLSTYITPVTTYGYAGKLIVRDQAGNNNLVLSPDGTISGNSGVTINGNLTISNGTAYLSATNVYGLLQTMSGADITSSGNLYSTLGRLGKSAAGDIIDANGTTTFIKGSAGISFQVPNGTTGVNINSSGQLHCLNGFNLDGGAMNLASGSVINVSNPTYNITGANFAGTGITFASGAQFNAPILLQPGNTSTPSVIQIGTAGLGIKNNSGTKLMEIKNTGLMVISGATYYSAGSTGNVTGGGTFDGFDIAETSQVDQQYIAGTMVCPADTTTQIPYDNTAWHTADRAKPLMTLCTHDGCNLAAPVSDIPAFSAGCPNTPDRPDYDPTLPLIQALTMVGRVFVKTTHDIPGRVYVTSDGTGGVRQVVAGDKVMSIGATLGPTVNGMVPVLIRPTFVTL